MPSVTVIVPVYNEARTIDRVLHRLLAASDGTWQIIVVDDGSTDGTWTNLQRWKSVSNITLTNHQENLGKGSAVRTGLTQATGEVVVIQDADLEYDPADIPPLMHHFLDPTVQAVYGTRYGTHTRHPWTMFRMAVVLLNWLVRLLYGSVLRDEATCYKLVRRNILSKMQLQSNRFELCAEITGKLCRLGIAIREHPISYQPRGYGEGKKIGIGAFFRCVIQLVYWRYATFPPLEPPDPDADMNGRIGTHSASVRSAWGLRYWIRIALLSMIAGLTVWLSRELWLPIARLPSGISESTLNVTSSLNIGSIWESTEYRTSVDFHNSSTQQITIDRFGSSCDCARVMADKLVIPPGETRTVAVTLDLARNRPKDLSRTEWPVKYLIRAEWIDPNGRLQHSAWQLQGRAKAVFAAIPAALWLGEDLQPGQRGAARSTIIRPMVPDLQIEIISFPEGIDVDLQRMSDGFRLTATPTGAISPGYFSRDIVLRVAAGESRRLAPQSVTVFGTVLDDVDVIPSNLCMGNVNIGNHATAVLSLYSKTGVPFNLVDVRTSSGTSVISHSRTNDGFRVEIRQFISGAGNGASQPTLVLQLPSGRQISKTVEMHWYGVRSPLMQ